MTASEAYDPNCFVGADKRTAQSACPRAPGVRLSSMSITKTVAAEVRPVWVGVRV